MNHLLQSRGVPDTTTSRLLAISNLYCWFAKDQIEAVAPHFQHVDALIRYKPVAELSRWLPANALERHRKASLIDDEGKPENVAVHALPMFYLPTSAAYRRLGESHYRAAARAIRKKGIHFDIIHAHFAWSSGYAGMQLKRDYGVPLVITAYGYDVCELPFQDDGWRHRIEAVLNGADRIIAVSQTAAERIARLDVSTPVNVLPNGFRADRFHPRNRETCRTRLGLSQESRIVLSVGNLRKIKGHGHLIEAMKELLCGRTDLLCIIVGSGELKRSLKRQISRAGLQQRVVLAGGRPHSEIPLWMNACDVFVLPSESESFGVAQIEALACGKPVVATRNGGSEEIITDDTLGYLVAPGNPHALAEAIAAALDRTWDEGRITERARAFGWDKLTAAYLRIYEGLLT